MSPCEVTSPIGTSEEMITSRIDFLPTFAIMRDLRQVHN